MGKVLLRLVILFIYTASIGVAKWLLMWAINTKSQAVIFFKYNPHSSEWSHYFLKYLSEVGGVGPVVALVGLGFTVFYLLTRYGDVLHGYSPSIIFMLPLLTLWFLNSYFIYDYVGVYSNMDYEGAKGAPVLVEKPCEVFKKGDDIHINQKIDEIVDTEEYGDQVDKRRFLFIETALINGFHSRSNYTEGIGDYIYALFFALIEYVFVALLYLFVPLVIYEIWLLKKKYANLAT